MTDVFAKTLVIDDPNYAPGSLGTPQTVTGVAHQQPMYEHDDSMMASADAAPLATHSDADDELPAFDDTSWLT